MVWASGPLFSSRPWRTLHPSRPAFRRFHLSTGHKRESFYPENLCSFSPDGSSVNKIYIFCAAVNLFKRPQQIRIDFVENVNSVFFAKRFHICYDNIHNAFQGGTDLTKRIFLLILTLFALAVPAFAAVPGQSQVVLAATEEGRPGACTDVGLGSYAADTMRQAAGTDIALLPTGLLGLSLPSGPIDSEALALSFPADETVYTITLTAAQLREILEISAAPLCLNKEETLDRDASTWGGFLQLSGLHVIYNVPSLPGNKLYELKLDDASEPDLTNEALTFTAAVPASLLDGSYGYPVLPPEREVGSLRSLLKTRIDAEGIDTAPETRRIILYGAYENNIIDAFPPLLIVFVILLFAVFGGHKWCRKASFER